MVNDPEMQALKDRLRRNLEARRAEAGKSGEAASDNKQPISAAPAKKEAAALARDRNQP